MHAILHDLYIKAKPAKVYSLISKPRGLNKWWTQGSEGTPSIGEKYRFFFTEAYDWAGIVTKVKDNKIIEWEMMECDKYWNNTIVGMTLSISDDGTIIQFYHKNWKEQNEHFRRSSYCWAIYLRLLKRNIEHDEFVPYQHRNNA